MADQCGGRIPDGGRCPWTAAETLAGVPLCRSHGAGIREALAAELAAPAGPPMSVVYYIGDPDSQLVKIGTSSSLRGRIGEIRKRRPRAVLLATEPGGYPVETRRHDQFASLNEPLPTGEREWFRKVPLLMAHIGEVRRSHGILCPGKPLWRDMIAPLRE